MAINTSDVVTAKGVWRILFCTAALGLFTTLRAGGPIRDHGVLRDVHGHGGQLGNGVHCDGEAERVCGAPSRGDVRDDHGGHARGAWE